MPFTSELSADKKVIFTTYRGEVNLDEIQSATRNALGFLDASEDKLYILTELTDVISTPNRIVEVWQLAHPIAKHKKFAGWLLIGANNIIARFVVQMIAKFAKIPYREFATRADALAYLAEKSQDL